MKQELVGGLKNAIERGDSLDKAVQSFINSGYNEAEVRAAASELKRTGATSIIHPEEGEEEEEEDEETSESEKPEENKEEPAEPKKIEEKTEESKEGVKKLPSGKKPEVKKRDIGKTILIIGLILIALGAIGAIIAILLLG